jgi:hypothetical protein
MKKLIKTLVILVTFSGSTMAKSGFTAEKEIVINVSAEKLWQMVGPGFVDVYKWSSNIDHATGTGTPEFEGATCSERSCDVNVAGFSSIKESLTNYNRAGKTLTYTVSEGMPGFVTLAENTWTVVAIDDQHSKLVMNTNFESKGLMGYLMNGMMRKKMNETLGMVLKDAKVYAETGVVSEAKQARINELASKKAA